MNALDLDDEYLTLAEACARFFRNRIKPPSLRAEARRGRLNIVRVGRTDFVAASAIRRLMVPCQEDDSPRDSTSEKTSKSGLSETERNQSAQAAARQIARQLKGRSLITSPESSRRPSASVTRIDSRLRKS